MEKDKLTNIRKEMVKKKVDAVLVSNASNIEYLTGYSNFSRIEREGYLLITSEAQYVITDGRYTEAVKKDVPNYQLIERKRNHSLKQIIQRIVRRHKLKTLGIESANLSAWERDMLVPLFNPNLNIKRKGKGNFEFENVSHFSVGIHRSIKTAEEIGLIEEACRIGDMAYNSALGDIRGGISEIEISDRIDKVYAGEGSVKSFDSIIAFGPNAAVPHHETGKTILDDNSGEGQIIQFDIGAKKNGYCSDMSRVAVFGQASDEMKRIYQTVLDAQQRAVDVINELAAAGKPIPASLPDLEARKVITGAGYPDYSHSLGHGTGMDVHEYPTLSTRSKAKLKPGMVFSIEPGIYLPGYGGMRIEDLYVLEPKGLRQLTKASKELIEI